MSHVSLCFLRPNPDVFSNPNCVFLLPKPNRHCYAPINTWKPGGRGAIQTLKGALCVGIRCLRAVTKRWYLTQWEWEMRMCWFHIKQQVSFKNYWVISARGRAALSLVWLGAASECDRLSPTALPPSFSKNQSASDPAVSSLLLLLLLFRNRAFFHRRGQTSRRSSVNQIPLLFLGVWTDSFIDPVKWQRRG